MLLLAVVLTRVERTAPEQLVSDELASKRMALIGFSPLNELDRVPLGGGAIAALATSTTTMNSLVKSGSAI